MSSDCIRDRAALLAEFQVIAARYDLSPSLTPFLVDLVQKVPRDAFSRSFLPDDIALLIGEIDEESANDLIQDMWDIHQDIALDRPLKLIMSTCGGQVYSGLAIIGAINELRRQGREVHIHVSGWALSMGFDILQSATYRTMEPTSYLMLHEEQYAMDGSTSAHEEETRFSKGQEALMLEILSQRTGRPVKYYREKIAHKNWYIGPQEALAEGLIDDVRSVPPFHQTLAQSIPPKRKVRGPRVAKREPELKEDSANATASTPEIGGQQS